MMYCHRVSLLSEVVVVNLVYFGLFQVRRFIMSPIKDPHLELVIVIFIVPFIVNVSTVFCNKASYISRTLTVIQYTMF